MIWNIDKLLERIGLVNKPTLGMALSGGGAKGFSHLGVLMAFEKFGMRPEILAGVSAGSIAATLYGSGLSVMDIMECFTEYSSFSDYTQLSIPREGFFSMKKFGKLLESWLPITTLEEMKIPTLVCATDFDKGKSVAWARGEIVPRVLASCSIPIIFKPVRINGTHYVDGGVLRNLPAWAIRDYCKALWGINCTPLNPTYRYSTSITDIALRSYQLMAKANTVQDLELCDNIISVTQVHKVGTFALKSMRKAVANGYDEACKILEKTLN
ncbi:MAG: patatin-like phospholipase family protein [Muribaculum sp.]|nr:patatin-like phospholipase family protein [Muribaculum sp.]